MLLDTITLPDGLVWTDRYDWTPIAQSMTVSITGTVIIQEAAQLTGRPITLEGAEDQSWATRSQIDALYALTGTADKVMSLDLGEEGLHQVIWRRDQAPIVVSQVLRTVDPGPATMYAVMALRFIKID
jgi:hypothetical protein